MSRWQPDFGQSPVGVATLVPCPEEWRSVAPPGMECREPDFRTYTSCDLVVNADEDLAMATG